MKEQGFENKFNTFETNLKFFNHADYKITNSKIWLNLFWGLSIAISWRDHFCSLLLYGQNWTSSVRSSWALGDFKDVSMILFILHVRIILKLYLPFSDCWQSRWYKGNDGENSSLILWTKTETKKHCIHCHIFTTHAYSFLKYSS